jgi:hypothetical protein
MSLRKILLTIAFIGSLVVHFAFDVSLGVALLIFFVGWPIVGTLVTIDDDLPGGWNNPDGSVRPPWREAAFWGQIVAGLSVSAVGFAIDVGWNSRAAAPFWLMGLVAAVVSGFLITRQRARGLS